MGHHYECSKDHQPILIRFTSCSPDNGFGSATATDCMFYEIEDAAEACIIEAIESSEDSVFMRIDYDVAREIAADLASRADSLATGGKAHVRNKVAVA